VTARTQTQPAQTQPARAIRSRRRVRPTQVVGGVARTIGILVVVVVLLTPLLWMFLASLKTNIQIVDPSYSFVFTPTLKNFGTVFGAANLGPIILNSLIVGAGATLLALAIGALAAYGIARYRVKNATAFLLMARVIPGVSLVIPWYFLFAQVQLVGTYTVLILTHMFVTMPLVVAIMSSFFQGVPVELEEAAWIDGSSRIGAFFRIVLPLSVPGLATATILSFIFSWNNFMFSLVLSNRNTRTLPVAVVNFLGYANIDWGGLMAAAVVITLPVMLLALVAQRYVVSGLTAGATKG